MHLRQKISFTQFTLLIAISKSIDHLLVQFRFKEVPWLKFLGMLQLFISSGNNHTIFLEVLFS